MQTYALKNFRQPLQTDPPRPAREILPTMYDLPSEDPEEPGLPDEFHLHQPQLLRETFAPRDYPPEQVFIGADINLYYDVHHTRRYKRPDWFAVVGVPRFYKKRDLRLSYVIWQESVAPAIVVELLSPCTEKEDLGRSAPRDAAKPPGKWEVYEHYLKVPYYVVFSRYTDEPQFFILDKLRYRKANLPDNRLWLPKIKLGLGLWQGVYQGLERVWLRWYDADGKWIPTEREEKERERKAKKRERKAKKRERKAKEWERKEKERERKEKERERKEKERERKAKEQAERRVEELAAQLRELGIEPSTGEKE
ncbi:MAG: Uma2 family endonuclease [Gammaproteobacteria bacterium]|nr:Uma2 family endonuclease [Gammaproteobacteria bacterium]